MIKIPGTRFDLSEPFSLLKSRINRPASQSSQLNLPETLGLSLWGLALFLILIKVAIEPAHHTVVDSYLLGAQRWLDRVDLYSGPRGFIYTPTFALLFSPLAQLPHVLTDLIWRLAIIGFYLYSLISLIRVFQAAGPRRLASWLGLASLIAVPIAFSGFRNGQLNVVLIATMVLVCSLLIRKNWNQAAFLLALVMSLKPTFIVFFLLTTTLFRPLWLRVPAFLLAFLALPALFAGWGYAAAQYVNFIDMAQSAAELGVSTPRWASLFNVPKQLWDITVNSTTQNLIKVVLAAATWALCFRVLIRLERQSALIYLLSLAACYHLMFNPRSVNTDYIILGTVMGFWFTAACYLWQDKVLARTVGCLAIGVLSAFELSRLIAPGTTSWVNPLMALLFSMVVIQNLMQDREFKMAKEELPPQRTY